ncbi:MAG: antitoxin of toxin-antitoxin stability system [Gammaproteobacteria bacterium]|nr:antitoxin of toxin-antitoxin stability system [Gammaproteobacteria bacterium]MBU1803841.1 antitoxin of toxin-antitoxin stability system [Gammaproteobacteria bacterium]
MPALKQYLIYTFDELSEAAKEKAREWYRDGQLDYDWWDFVYEQADTAAKHLGIDIDRKGKHTPAIYFSGFSSQGDGACFEGTYRYKKGWRSALLHEFGPGDTLNELLSIGQSLQEIQSKQFYKLEATCRHRGHYQHSGCMSVEVTHADSMYRDIGDAEDDIKDQLRLFADWIYDRLEQEHDWLTADEQSDESMRAGGYTFNEDGGFEG